MKVKPWHLALFFIGLSLLFQRCFSEQAAHLVMIRCQQKMRILNETQKHHKRGLEKPGLPEEEDAASDMQEGHTGFTPCGSCFWEIGSVPFAQECVTTSLCRWHTLILLYSDRGAAVSRA